KSRSRTIDRGFLFVVFFKGDTWNWWDFWDEVAEVLENPTPQPRAVLNEVEMLLRCTLNDFGLVEYHFGMENMLAKLRAMYGSTSFEALEETEAHRRSPTGTEEQQQQQAHQSAPSASGASEQARPTIGDLGEAPIPLRVVPLIHIDDVVRNEEEFQ
ncbi:hypothetical protein Dimus_006024, partial [Dionaea muscipula]